MRGERQRGIRGRAAKALVVVAGLTWLGGCERVYRAPIEDELGRECRLACHSGEERCRVTSDVEPMPEGGCGSFEGEALFVPLSTFVCEACGQPGKLDYSNLDTCAQLVCEVAEDCGYSEVACTEGVCVSEVVYTDAGRRSTGGP